MLEIPEAEAQNIVNTYRMTYATIPHLWRVLENIFVERRYYTYKNCLTFDRDKILLPNGMRLMYPNLRI